MAYTYFNPLNIYKHPVSQANTFSISKDSIYTRIAIYRRLDALAEKVKIIQAWNNNEVGWHDERT